MKTIKCRKCKKTVEVEDNYPVKTCVICRTKEKERLRVKRETKELDRQLTKSLQITDVDKQKLPKMFWHYSNFIDAFEERWHRKPSFPEYEKAKTEWKKNQLKKDADVEITESKTKLTEAKKLLRFDIWSKNNKQCEAFRLSKILKKKEIEAISKHVIECESCRDWNYNFEEGLILTEEQEAEAWSQETPKDIDDDIDVEKHHKEANEFLELLREPSHEPKEETESTLESESETQRVLDTPKDKLEEWSKSPETDEESSSEPPQQEPLSYSQQLVKSFKKKPQEDEENSNNNQ